MKFSSIKTYLRDVIATIRKKGLVAAWKKYRWELVVLIIVYYLIRDTFLYILLPLAIASRI